jgi:hypothetical protein
VFTPVTPGPPAAPEQPEAPRSVDPHDRHGFTFDVRIGFAAPFGNAVISSSQMGQQATGIAEANTSALLLPLWLDAIYRITPRWHAGLYFQIADAFSGATCSNGCGGYDVRFGLAGEYHFAPARKADGWVGLGAGYEILHTSTSNAQVASSSVTTAYRGFEFGMLQAGVDLRAGQGAVRWGPFTALTLAQYDHVRQISSAADISITPTESIHLWFFVGLRGSYDL